MRLAAWRLGHAMLMVGTQYSMEVVVPDAWKLPLWHPPSPSTLLLQALEAGGVEAAKTSWVLFAQLVTQCPMEAVVPVAEKLPLQHLP